MHVHFGADAGGDGGAKYAIRQGDIPDGDAQGLEKGLLMRRTAPGGEAGDDVAHLDDFVPTGRADFDRGGQVARFDPGLLDVGGGDEVEGGEGGVIELASLDSIGTHGHDVSAGSDGRAGQDGLQAVGGGDDEVGSVASLPGAGYECDLEIQGGAHFGGESLPAGGGQIAGTGNGLKLGASLVAAADDGDDGGIFAGQIFGGHPAGGAGTKLAGSASFDDGLELAGGSR